MYFVLGVFVVLRETQVIINVSNSNIIIDYIYHNMPKMTAHSYATWQTHAHE